MSDVLGMNARNFNFISRENKRGAVRIADSKSKTKSILSRFDIPTMPLLAKVTNYRDIKKLNLVEMPGQFVIKPDRGLAGGGILVINEITEDEKGKPAFKTSSGKIWKEKEIKDHLRDILDGNFSISGTPDIAIIEEKAILDPEIRKIAPKGVPDIRIITYNKVPVIAMMRIPTEASHGKANLKLGAIGVGIDIATGKTTTAEIQKPKRMRITKHPENKFTLKGFQIPRWNDILEIAVKCQEASGLGYMGADIVPEKNRGPVVFEINARPGLEIQNVNESGLYRRLERVKGLKIDSVAKGIRVAKELFGDIENRVEDISGKQIIGLSETIELRGKDNKKIKTLAKIETGSALSSISKSIAEKLGFNPEEKTADISILLEEIRFSTKVKIDDSVDKKFSVVIGQKDLKSFIIDPSKKDKVGYETNKISLYQTIDRKLADSFRGINIIRSLTPTNLQEQKQLFFKKEIDSPIFEYGNTNTELLKLQKEKLKSLKLDSSTLGTIFGESRDEQLKKIDLVMSIGNENFNEKSEALYGSPAGYLVEYATKNYKRKSPSSSSKQFIRGEEVYNEIKKFLVRNQIPHRITMMKELSSRVSVIVSENRALVSVRNDAKFTKEELRGTIAHEIETHLYRALNAQKQKYKIFSMGLSGYKDAEEGLAIKNKEVIYKNPRRYDTKCIYVLAIKHAQSHSFSETFGYLKTLGVDDNASWNITYKVKRGLKDTSKPGAFTKDLVYLRGFLEIDKLWNKPETIKRLYIGRIGISSLKLIDNLNFINPPKYLPEFFNQTK